MNSSCSIYVEGEGLDDQLYGPNSVGSDGESDKEMLSSCSLLYNDSKGVGSTISMANKPGK